MARKPKQQVVVKPRNDRGGRPQVIWRGPDGREHRRLFDAEEAAHAFAAQVSKEIAIGVAPVENRDVKLKPHAESWLESRKTEIAPRTLATYRDNLARYVLPALGHLRVREIRRSHVMALVRGLRKNGYSANTVRLARASLSVLLTAALDEEIVDANVSLGLDRGRKGHAGRVSTHPKVKALNFEQREVFNATAFKVPLLGPYFILGTETGFRPSEGLALQPGDVDLAKRILRIERSLEKDGSIRPTKTYETRVIELSTLAVTILRHHLAWLRAESERRGWTDGPKWLFPSQQNTALDYSRMADEFRATAKAADLIGFVPYSMRHTFAALRLSSGALPMWVSQQLGHQDLTTTLRYYGEFVPKEGQTWADILEAKILEPAPLIAIPKPETRTKAEADPDWDSELAELTNEKAGAGGGSRTRDLLITNQLLCL